MRGRLVTIEGIDGAGKTTLATALERSCGAADSTSCCCASRAVSPSPNGSASW